MSEALVIALIVSIGPISAAIGSLATIWFKRRREQEKAYETAIDILNVRFGRANDPKELAAIEQQLREAEDDYLPYLRNKAASISARRVRAELAPTGVITPDMPELSPSDREALGKAAATIAALDPPKTAEDHFLQGNAFYTAREYDKSVSEYNAALELSPDNPDALNNRGNSLHNLKRYDEALADYNRSLELRPDDPVTLSNRAKALYYLTRYEEALPDFNRSLELRPDNPDTLYDRGTALGHLQRYEEALADFNRSLELRPDNPDALDNRGNTLDALQRYDEALADYNRSLELRPDDPDSLIARGLTLHHLQRYEEALADYNSALKLAPDDPNLIYNRACTFSLMRRLDEALEQLKEAISRDGTYRKTAREDEDFDNLRSDPKLGPEFERLVADPES